MELILSGLLPSLIMILIALIILWFISREFKRQHEKPKDDSSFLLIQNQLQEIARSNQDLKVSNEQLKSDLTEKLQYKIGESQKQMSDSVQTQLQESQKLIKDITAELSEVKGQNKQVLGFTEQLKSLQEVLQNSKQRGTLGEYYLETTLKNVLPPESFQMQYSFQDGTAVDAIIRLPDGVVPIDSKFSLENYNRLVQEKDKVKKEGMEKRFKDDIKLRITETAKYIKPREGTMDFAMMFIPSEGIYYDLLNERIGEVNSRNLMTFAYEKKVIMVSPTTFYAYLQTIMQGLNSLKIEKKAQEIIKNVEALKKHVGALAEEHERLGKSLGAAVNHFNKNAKRVGHISKDTIKLTSSAEDQIVIPEVISKIEQ